MILPNSELQLYSAINRIVQSKKISLGYFWSSDRLCVPLDDFIDMLSVMGIKVNSELLARLENDEVDLISLEKIIEKVQYWKQTEKSITAYLSKSSPIKQQISLRQSVSDWQPSHNPSQTQRSNYQTTTNKRFLSQHTKKKVQDEIKLNQTLKNAKNQSDYIITMKVGELNDICSKMRNNTVFWVERKTNGKVDIIVSLKGEPEKVISEKQFQIKYKDIKETYMNFHEEEQEQDMEEDLKKVLVEVMCLSSEMKKQIQLLQRKGVQH